MSYISRIAKAAPSLELSRDELAYYARHILLPGIGTAGQQKLKAARVLVIGAGGLGCPVLQALAGAGVGQLTVVDGDVVSISNLSRQWLHRCADDGRNKALSAVAALRELNPFIELVAESTMLSPDNVQSLVDLHDIAIDATDDLDVRYWIDDACAVLSKPWVHAALYRENAQLTVFWARFGTRFRKLYPEPVDAPSCSGAGMLGATASVVGNLQALECVKLIVGHARPQIGQLIVLDAAGLILQSFRLPDVDLPSLIEVGHRTPDRGLLPEHLRQVLSIHEPIQLLDLRSCAAYQAGSIEGAMHCPAEQVLEAGLPACAVPRVVLICEEGLISSMLVEALSQRCPYKLEHLEGGFIAWAQGSKL
jgi:adenylyltransferase/sulfurtransferase